MISLQLIWLDVLGLVDIALENVLESSWSLVWIVLERFKSLRIPLSSYIAPFPYCLSLRLPVNLNS